MFLKEFEGRALFEKYRIPVARGVLLRGHAGWEDELHNFLDSSPDALEFAVKAQVLSGKRGISGGILFCERRRLLDTVKHFFGSAVNNEKVEEILVQDKLEILEEYYLSVTIDRFLRQMVVVFSAAGGIEIEEIARKFPDNVVMINCDGEFEGDALESRMAGAMEKLIKEDGLRKRIAEIACRLYELFIEEDAVLAEINPLVLTKDYQLTAVDSKIVIDDNATSRHPSLLNKDIGGYSELELKARESGLSYVELDGDIAVIGNGAGLVMATLDSVEAYGGRPANFCDIGGGASSEMVRKAIEIVLQKKTVRVLLINVFGGITHCDEVAKGIIAGIGEGKKDFQVVIRLVGTNEALAHKLLFAQGYDVYSSFEESSKKAANLF